MGKFFDEIPQRLFDFIERSHVFFVATAPLQGGSVNVSPKASCTGDGKTRLFELIDKNRVRYLDLTGSGNETISHLLEPGNGRLTIMFVNIEAGAPNIVRLYGKATVHERGGVDPGRFASMWYGSEDAASQDIPIGGRAIIDLQIHTCSTSCGYSIPVFEYKKPRPVLDDFFVRANSKGVEAMAKSKAIDGAVPAGVLLPPSPPASTSSKDEYADDKSSHFEPRPVQDALETYWALCNNLSIDGMPGLSSVRDMRREDEYQRLSQKREEHDRLQPPPTDLPPSYHKRPGSAQAGTEKDIVVFRADVQAHSPWSTTITIQISPIAVLVAASAAYLIWMMVSSDARELLQWIGIPT